MLTIGLLAAWLTVCVLLIFTLGHDDAVVEDPPSDSKQPHADDQWGVGETRVTDGGMLVVTHYGGGNYKIILNPDWRQDSRRFAQRPF